MVVTLTAGWLLHAVGQVVFPLSENVTFIPRYDGSEKCYCTSDLATGAVALQQPLACVFEARFSDKEAAKRILMRDTAYFDTQLFYKQLKGGMYKEALWFKRQARSPCTLCHNPLCSALFRACICERVHLNTDRTACV